MRENPSATGAPPQTPLGELTAPAGPPAVSGRGLAAHHQESHPRYQPATGLWLRPFGPKFPSPR